MQAARLHRLRTESGARHAASASGRPAQQLRPPQCAMALGRQWESELRTLQPLRREGPQHRQGHAAHPPN
eukprot:11998969-Heterocapsa_arctica.AAC.1